MTWKRYLILAAAFGAGLALASSAFGAEASPTVATSLDEYHSATCRVVAKDANGGFGVGTGTHVGVIYPKNAAPRSVVLTNAHVVDDGTSFVCQFFGDGRPNSFDAALEKKWFDGARQYDFAFLSIPRSELSALDPPRVRLPPLERAETSKSAPFASCGCPEAREPMLFKGRRVGEYGRIETFKPAPLQGQSGSTAVQIAPDGSLEARSIVSYRMSETATDYDFDKTEGGMIALKYLYEAASGRVGDFSAPIPQWLIPIAAPKRVERAFAKFDANGAAKPPVESKTTPLLLYFSASWCKYCKTTTPIVDELSRRFAIRKVDVDAPEGLRAWREYGFNGVPAFAFIAVDSAGKWDRTLDAWTGAGACRERIVENFARFRPTYPRPKARPIVARFDGGGEAVDAAQEIEIGGDGGGETSAVASEEPAEPAVENPERPATVDELLRVYERGLAPWNGDASKPNDAPEPSGPTGLFPDRANEFLDKIEADVRARLDAAEQDVRRQIGAEITNLADNLEKKGTEKANALVEAVREKAEAEIAATVQKFQAEIEKTLTDRLGELGESALDRIVAAFWRKAFWPLAVFAFALRNYLPRLRVSFERG